MKNLKELYCSRASAISSLRRAAVCLGVTMAVSTGVLSAVAQDAPVADAHTIITLMPKNKETAPTVTPANVAAKLDGKQATTASLSHYDDVQPNLQLLMLIDDSARSSMGLYLKEIASFLTTLPPNVAVGVAYIENGGAHMAQPFTMDHAAAAKVLHLPASPSGASADPYIALTELAKSWPPSPGGKVRHEVVMISNGVDAYGGLRYDPENPYITNAINSAQKAGILVYSIYFKDRGFAQRFGAAVNSGQNYLIQMSEATGGELFYTGFDNPVSFAPYFDQIQHNIENQYELRLAVPAKVKDGLQSLKVKVNVPNTKVESPSSVLVGETAERQ
jgi:VWFA-related protein